jgi:hypothetical protein
MAVRRTAAARSGGQGCDIPSTSSKGYHTAARGQSQATPRASSPRAAPRQPRGRAAPDRRDATRAPACKISVTLPPMRSLVGPFVGRLSGRNNGEQRGMTLTNDEYCRWSASPPPRGPQPCLVSQKIDSHALAGPADLRD